MAKKAGTMIVVAAALADGEGRVLLQRRPEGKAMAGLWEFPGGKIEEGERPEAALVRELEEELGVAVDERALAPAAFASADNGGRPMLLLLYLCRAWRGEPAALHASELAWVAPADMPRLPMPPADVPLVEALARLLAPPRNGEGVGALDCPRQSKIVSGGHDLAPTHAKHGGGGPPRRGS